MFVGRKIELSKLKQQVQRQEASFVAIYGRRRIGKTVLVREFCKINEIKLIEFTGQHQATLNTQLSNFRKRLRPHSSELAANSIHGWEDAFEQLSLFLKTWQRDKKLILFFDEMPWLDSRRSRFLSALADFWGFTASQYPNVTVIICGSAATYMINKVEKNKGPLHNRVTAILRMKAFNLHDMKALILSRNWHLSDKSIVDLYLTFGGVAKYLADLDQNLTYDQAVQESCFSTNAIMAHEYSSLFDSLFEKAKAHNEIMNTLSQRWSGLTQQGIIDKTNLPRSTMNDALSDLVASGFIEKKSYINKKSHLAIFYAVDFFSYFHHKWIATKNVHQWSNMIGSQSYRSWAGFAFEKLCHTHEYQIKKSLGIDLVETASSYWAYVPEQNSGEKGAQIDMLIQHLNGSNNIEIVECKYYDSEFTITKEYKENLLNKRHTFIEQMGAKYNCRFSIITPNGVTKNEHFNELNPKVITLTELFSPEER